MAFIATQPRPSTSAPRDASRTQTITGAPPQEDAGASINPEGPLGVLRLRGGPRNRQRVAWDEDVVDNEGCGRKSSKICCIYHKPRKFDESSSEESSDSDSDCDHRHQHRHSHSHRPSPGGDDRVRPQMRPDQPATVHQLDGDVDRNAYERMPSSNKGKRKACVYWNSMEAMALYSPSIIQDLFADAPCRVCACT
ncbi:phosphatase inhibitor-domain-containing protein [Collybia nuda]|uniref:Type 1 phosphatases regulator n=1 Tax=Collybia nuda TaxID=64659 RepID=A0A9P5Y053_9AGAR|nr:phosphatase inhibitor-domain-containing protein [Collybia nuda]